MTVGHSCTGTVLKICVCVVEDDFSHSSTPFVTTNIYDEKVSGRPLCQGNELGVYVQLKTT